jgi:hypothetical protein
MKRIILSFSIVALLFVFPSNFFAYGPKIINSHVVGSVPNVTVRGVASGGAPWVVKNGKIQLDSDGHLSVRVKGLVIGDGGTGEWCPRSAGTGRHGSYCNDRACGSDVRRPWWRRALHYHPYRGRAAKPDGRFRD